MTDEGKAVEASWGEAESAQFIERGQIYTPRRAELLATFLDLIPADIGESFTGVELGTGSGWLTEGILDRFPQARMIGLDGSEAMRRSASETMARFHDRFEIRHFRLEENS